MLTQQEMLDRVVQWFIVEKHLPAVEHTLLGVSGVCQYRTPDGRRCAIGLFIPDDRYVEEMDIAFNTVAEVVKMLPDIFPSPDNLEMNQFYSDLQMCHDDADEDNFTEELSSNLVDLAIRYSLALPAALAATKGH